LRCMMAAALDVRAWCDHAAARCAAWSRFFSSRAAPSLSILSSSKSSEWLL
jgi:hypothetical protein